MKLQKPGFWWYPINEEKFSTLSPVKLFLAISFGTLMTKHLYFSTLNSFRGKKNAALGRKGFSPDTYKVVNVIVDGLTSQRPQTRYVVGLDGKLMVFLSYLPTYIADYVLRVK